jgi:transposase
MMAKPLLPDELWQEIEPLLPAPKPRRFRYPGRKPISHRQALTGIIFVLKSGIPWELLPQEMGCGSGMSCWRRLRDWQRAGVWQRVQEHLLARLQGAEAIDWSRAVHGGAKSSSNPTDRRKAGSKHHLVVDAQGIPLAPLLTEAQRHDVTQLLPLVEAIAPVRGRRGRPRRRPERVQGDRA